MLFFQPIYKSYTLCSDNSWLKWQAMRYDNDSAGGGRRSRTSLIARWI